MEYVIPFLLAFIFCLQVSFAQLITPADASKYAAPIAGEDVLGRWDISLDINGTKQPSWLEIAKSGSTSFVGSFVGRSGSARPVSQIIYNADKKEYSFSIPSQWGRDQTSATFTLDENKLIGLMDIGDQQSIRWMARRAPILNKQEQVMKWDSPQDLLAEGLESWENTRGWKMVSFRWMLMGQN